MTRSPLFKGFPSKRLGEFINFTGIDSKYKASEERSSPGQWHTMPKSALIRFCIFSTSVGCSSPQDRECEGRSPVLARTLFPQGPYSR